MNKFSNNELKSAGFRIKSGMTEGGEQGRSMVEMLGVLAVIGVLSVAGIEGYSIATRSYRTNEIVNAASMLYIMAMAQNAGNGPTGNVGYIDVGGTSNPSGVSSFEYNKDTKAISITFTDTDDCTMAKNKLGDKATGDCPNLTVNFGETTTSEEPTQLDNTEWFQGSCQAGYAPVVGPCPDSCARNLEEAIEACTSPSCWDVTTSAQVKEYPSDAPAMYAGKKYFSCT